MVESPAADSTEITLEIPPVAHISQQIALLGLKSTDPALLEFFAARKMKKPPKTVNANQSAKLLADPQSKVSYRFQFDITHDDFYPPVSPKKDNYNFECYLMTIALFSKERRKTQTPAYIHPEGFWDGYLHPDSSRAEYMAYICRTYCVPSAIVQERGKKS